MRRSLFGLVAVAAIAVPAFAEDAPPADKPAPTVGDVFEFAKRFVTVDCKRWEVKEVGKDGYNLLQCGDNLAYIDAATATVARIVTADGKRLVEYKPGSPYLSFPLEVGKKWDGKYDGYRNGTGSWESTVSCQAKSFEPIKVAAGEFQAYRIECADNWQAMGFRGVADSTAWYVPKLGMVVKSVNPSQSDYEYELVAYHVK
ncbi:MAG: hypothetical protein ACLQJR_09855 [Stellaceae bacterium]